MIGAWLGGWLGQWLSLPGLVASGELAVDIAIERVLVAVKSNVLDVAMAASLVAAIYEAEAVRVAQHRDAHSVAFAVDRVGVELSYER